MTTLLHGSIELSHDCLLADNLPICDLDVDVALYGILDERKVRSHAGASS
jgi:hypothetical protein